MGILLFNDKLQLVKQTGTSWVESPMEEAAILASPMKF
jgi:hypothetical protein